MINKDTLTMLNELGFGADVDAFESYVETLRDAYAMGNPIVEDSQYDLYHKLLSDLKPESKVLSHNWEMEETPMDKYDKILEQYGMCSIQTLDGINKQSLSNFINVIRQAGGKVDVFASMKKNGHAIRAVYAYGELHSGTTRGRYNKGRDITRHLKRLLPERIDGFKSMPLVEIRGEMLVKKETFENRLKQYGLKTPLSSVTSLIRESATDAEIDMLDVVCYKVIPSEMRFRPKTLEQEFNILRMCEMKRPHHVVVKDVTENNLIETIDAILEYFEELMDAGEIEYDCDGIVVAVNDCELFYSAGKDGNHYKGNFAVKEGKYWQSSIYSSVIEEVVWERGKKYLTPKAIVTPVICRNGAQVVNVPLYNVGVMERYQLYTGQEIHFKFGGEKGVTLCDAYGRSVRVDSF